MPKSRSEIVITDFLNQLNKAPESILLLDYDGTLAPFQKERDRAYPYPGVLNILEDISQCKRTRIVIISGRSVREIQTLLSPLGNLEIWGAHGLEHLLADGTYSLTAINSDIKTALLEAADWLNHAKLSSFSETKPGGVAIHWRGLPSAEIERLQILILKGWMEFARKPGLKLLHFDGGMELRATRPDKGDAVAATLRDKSSEASIAFLGDDFTDEDGFRALDKCGLSVLVRSEYRDTAANAWLKPPDELIDFLGQWRRSACR